MTYKVRLKIFEGPLDLLLYLIKKDELDIYNIPITHITQQYLEYLNLMETMDLDIAGEFLVMAATLMHIKSKTLLPPDPEEPQEEADPRADLVKRLLEYKAFKEAAEKMRAFEDDRSGIFTRFAEIPDGIEDSDLFMEVTLFDVLTAFSKILRNLPKGSVHEVVREEYSVADKVHEIVHRLTRDGMVRFSELFRMARTKDEAITTFLAILELVRLKEVSVAQGEYFGEIEIQRRLRPVVHNIKKEEEGNEGN